MAEIDEAWTTECWNAEEIAWHRRSEPSATAVRIEFIDMTRRAV